MARQALAVSLVGLGLMIVAGCSTKTAGTFTAPKISASAAGAAALAEYDANKDGKISGAELDKSPALKAALSRIDKDNDKAITADEIAARITEWQASNTKGIAVPLTVLLKGKPLADADVKLVPEKFLGDNLPVAMGKTIASGQASPSIPQTKETDMRGVPMGFYKVEITKSGANIPAIYNTQTTLGVEVARDASWMGGEGATLVFQLK